MRRSDRHSKFVLVVGACVIAAACGGSSEKHSTPCESGASRECPCANGEVGREYCAEDGSGWGECQCSGEGVGGAGGSGGLTAAGGSGGAASTSGGAPGAGGEAGASVSGGAAGAAAASGAAGTGWAEGGTGGDVVGRGGMSGGAGDAPTAGVAGVAGGVGGRAGADGGAGAGGAAGAPVTGAGGGTSGTAGVPGVGGDSAAGGSPAQGGTLGTGGTAGASGSAGAAGAGDQTPSCQDGVQNQDETDDDCGGDLCPGCRHGQSCQDHDDCSSGLCLGGTCDAPSCDDGLECNGESCCTSIVVPAGTFPMGRTSETCSDCTDGCPAGMSCDPDELPEHPASVASFVLDKYPVTVARFRAFVLAGGGTQDGAPSPGDGAFPGLAGSGWALFWNADLVPDQAALVGAFDCDLFSPTWASGAGPNDQYPMNCVTWYEAFAFCIWDGGRLPTEAEREYVAAGGDENRLYPWGNDHTELLPANYESTDDTARVAVGSHPDGDGRWGHADLGGGVWEWLLDGYTDTWYTTVEEGCTDCVNQSTEAYRVVRGSYWGGWPQDLRVTYRQAYAPTARGSFIGFRCARDVR